ncbi:MAG: helicase [Planctomycetaceae bacterium]|nr:MAG: helicase [Planctomycetaceae bacterium]
MISTAAGKATRGKGTIAKRPSPGSRHQSPTNLFHQRLGALTYYQACQLLGEEGAQRLQKGDQQFEILSDQDVFLGHDQYRVRVTDPALPTGLAVVTLTLDSGRNKRLRLQCDCGEPFCLHSGAAINHLLDGKESLGLAAPPDETVPLELLTHEELHARAISDRARRAAEEPMRVRALTDDRPWSDYLVTSERSGKTYRVALRGYELGQSYCSCPDFRTNGLGTCKHILHSLGKIEKRFSAAKLRAPYYRRNLSVRVDYTAPVGLRFNLPTRPDPRMVEIVEDSHLHNVTDVQDVVRRIQALAQAGVEVHLYPDAEEYIQRALIQDRLSKSAAEIRRDPAGHPLRRELLSVELLPYQMDGIAFAVGAGRVILADDMGLGKTIQGIGTAELLARWAEIQRVLVICPASLKSQWRSEIARFSGRSTQVVVGTGAERAEQYASDTFFTICNYEQVLRDLREIETVPWDLIILDEGQRIKNWESKTSSVIRSLQSDFRLVLSGTPLENHLGELFTVARFVDEHRLGAADRFFNRHRIVDDRGKVVGYQNLDQLRESLAPILLRRTRAEVAKQLPERTDEVVRIEPTAEQLEIHDGNLTIAAQIAAKKFLTEIDLLRLQKALLLARMSADSTFLVDKQEPEYSSKLERLAELWEGLLVDPTRKIVLFSEWRTMLDRIERQLDDLGCDYVRLDGQVPQKKRPAIVERFQSDPECRVILMTNAGSTGLNLQSANVVINVDLPWNPAVLEQRIARAHRMGQRNPVHVYKLVTTGTIEERLLDTLASKQDLADAALDITSEVDSIEMVTGIADLRRRLEKILTPPPPAPVDESQLRRVEMEAASIQAKREGVAAATGQLVGAALALAGQLLSRGETSAPDNELVDRMTDQLTALSETDAQGRPQITISLPDEQALRGIAMTLAHLLK